MTGEGADAKLQAQYRRFVDAVEEHHRVVEAMTEKLGELPSRAEIIARIQRAELEWSGKPLSDDEAGDLVDDMLRARARSRSVWTSPHEWRDPDCIECDGQGAPCCEPPPGPPPVLPKSRDGMYPRCVWCRGENYALAVLFYSAGRFPCAAVGSCGRYLPEAYVATEAE